MTESTTRWRPARTVLLVGLAGVAVAAAAFAIVRLGPTGSQPTAADPTSAPRAVPPIDAAQPARTETATFAMG